MDIHRDFPDKDLNTEVLKAEEGVPMLQIIMNYNNEYSLTNLPEIQRAPYELEYRQLIFF